MKYLLVGAVVALIGVVISIIGWGVHMIPVITSGTGLVLLVAACIFSGVFISGDRMRLNSATETYENRLQRNKIAFNAVLIAIPNMVVALAFYFLAGS
ncbi:DUF5316 domain-containing protein [Solibacillus silvestris]|uniref:DUF5316 domain-containing protein n=1 Tax=Solibacillus silvestris TaxID=76853 RepID=UPI003F7DAF0B